jgi:energy-coupling factor transport system permease protein
VSTSWALDARRITDQMAISTTVPPSSAASTRPGRLPRVLHPGAWWIWALGMATAASRTTNPLLLCLVIAVVAFVVSARRSDAPWARGFRYYLYLAAFVVLVRMLFRMLFDGQAGATVLFTLPEVPLPESAAGVRIGGPVSAEGLLTALYDGLRLATLLVCVGAANALANPKRLLASLPGALHEVGVTITVALTIAPQLVESAQRVHRARRLRGEVGRRTRLFREVAVPVMTDALDRSLLLAAAMDARGYGRHGATTAAERRRTGALVLLGLLGVCVGVYGVLDATTPRALGLPMLAVGVALAGTGFLLGGRRVQRTRYRPDPWRSPEWGVAMCGAVVAVAMVAIGHSDPAALDATLDPLAWPALPLTAAAAVLVGVLPAWLAPPTPDGRR